MKQVKLILLLFLPVLSCCEKVNEKDYLIKFYGDAWEDIGYSISIASDGYIIAGQFQDLLRINGRIAEDSADRNMAVIKTDWNGIIRWKRSFGGNGDDTGTKIYQNTDGSMICVGTYSHSSLKKEIYAVKLNASGEKVWEKTYGGAENQRGKDIIKTPDGYMILGTTDAERLPLTDSTGNQAGKSDIFLVKISDNGDFAESFAYGYPGNDDAAVIKSDIDGNYIVLGTTDRSDPGQGGNNLLIIRVNAIGYAIKPRILGTEDDEYAADMEVLSDGYLLAGTLGGPSTSQQAFIVKIKQDIYQPPVYTPPYRINNSSTAVNAIAPYGPDNYIVAGHIGSSQGTRMLIYRTGTDGVPVPDNNMIWGGSGGDQVAYDVTAGDDGYVLAVGRNRYDVNSMISLLKFRF